jgi:hypothetical protein
VAVLDDSLQTAHEHDDRLTTWGSIAMGDERKSPGGCPVGGRRGADDA